MLSGMFVNQAELLLNRATLFVIIGRRSGRWFKRQLRDQSTLDDELAILTGLERSV